MINKPKMIHTFDRRFLENNLTPEMEEYLMNSLYETFTKSFKDLVFANYKKGLKKLEMKLEVYFEDVI